MHIQWPLCATACLDSQFLFLHPSYCIPYKDAKQQKGWQKRWNKTKKKVKQKRQKKWKKRKQLKVTSNVSIVRRILLNTQIYLDLNITIVLCVFYVNIISFLVGESGLTTIITNILLQEQFNISLILYQTMGFCCACMHSIAVISCYGYLHWRLFQLAVMPYNSCKKP